MKKTFAKIWLQMLIVILFVSVAFIVITFIVAAFQGQWVGIIILGLLAAIVVTLWAMDTLNGEPL